MWVFLCACAAFLKVLQRFSNPPLEKPLEPLGFSQPPLVFPKVLLRTFGKTCIVILKLGTDIPKTQGADCFCVCLLLVLHIFGLIRIYSDDNSFIALVFGFMFDRNNSVRVTETSSKPDRMIAVALSIACVLTFATVISQAENHLYVQNPASQLQTRSSYHMLTVVCKCSSGQ